MRDFNKKEILPIALILIAFFAGIYLYSQLPERIPSHWNIRGEIDSWAGKNFGIFFIPVITLAIYLLTVFIPLIDPLRKNYSKFSSAYFWFRTVLVAFFVLLHFYILSAALGVKINTNYFMLSSFSCFFILLGLFLPKIKNNYFVGIRTPWTLHSEKVWEKTTSSAEKLL